MHSINTLLNQYCTLSPNILNDKDAFILFVVTNFTEITMKRAVVIIKSFIN